MEEDLLGSGEQRPLYSSRFTNGSDDRELWKKEKKTIRKRRAVEGTRRREINGGKFRHWTCVAREGPGFHR